MRKRILALILAGCMCVCLAGCGGGGKSSGGNSIVNFMYGGDLNMAPVFKFMIDEFNETVGKEEKITVKGVPKSGSVESVALQQLPTKNGPDVISLSDEYIKKCCRYLEDLTDIIGDKAYEDMYPNLRSRYHYDVETTTSNEDDPLYGIPAYNDATVLYYNSTALSEAGVICISVPEDELDAFNAGTGKDLNGKTKADYGISVNVPKKGFYRSLSPYVSDPDDHAARSWKKPSSDEVLIFNDRIPMNWDEVEDLGLICTKSRNSASPTQYGYYTEWWFNYGWSVGGDCVQDLDGNGNWIYSLPFDLPNYIVQEGKTYTGGYTGTVYQAGQTLDAKDILDVKPGDEISCETDGKTYYKYTVGGADAPVRDFAAEIAGGTLKKLPSIREAFTRFVYLSGVGGLNVCPYPSAFSGRSSTAYFTSGTLAMLVEYVHNADSIEKSMVEGDEYSIAPLPRYKVYTNPSDPSCDDVAVEGKSAVHSIGYSLSVGKNSPVKDAACEFVKWMSTDGQKALAKAGYVSCRKSDSELCKKNLKFKNPDVVMDSIAAAAPGDWWYMPDRSWIDTWANPLNNSVRYGKMEFDDFLYAYIDSSNERLKAYKK